MPMLQLFTLDNLMLPLCCQSLGYVDLTSKYTRIRGLHMPSCSGVHKNIESEEHCNESFMKPSQPFQATTTQQMKVSSTFTICRSSGDHAKLTRLYVSYSFMRQGQRGGQRSLPSSYSSLDEESDIVTMEEGVKVHEGGGNDAEIASLKKSLQYAMCKTSRLILNHLPVLELHSFGSFFPCVQLSIATYRIIIRDNSSLNTIIQLPTPSLILFIIHQSDICSVLLQSKLQPIRHLLPSHHLGLHLGFLICRKTANLLSRGRNKCLGANR